MKKKSTFIFLYASIILAIFPLFGREIGKTFFSYRPQGSNSAHKIAGTMYLEQIIPCIRNYDRFAITLEYVQTFHDREFGEFLFFNGGTRMKFGDADAPNVDIFSRNFFLNDDFQGTASIEPFIQNFITHLNLSLDASYWKPGLYIEARIPIVWTLWDLRLHESPPSTEKEGTVIPAQTFGNTFAKASPVKDITTAWKGTTLNTNSSSTVPSEDFFPDLKQPMKFASIDGPQTRANLGDVEIIVGYNIMTRPDAHFDIQGRLVIPTGNRPEAKFFFEPIVGNGHHFQIGLGVSGHDDLWCHTDNSFSYYIDGGIYYLFGARQKRTFDLKNNGIGSRYLLFKKFDAAGVFANEVLFGPNVTTLDCRVKSDFMADFSVAGEYTWYWLRVGLGYNLWARAREKIKLIDKIPSNTFGIQGKTTTADNNTASKTLISGKNASLIDPQPVFLRTNDIDITSAANPLSVSHKVFLYTTYAWLLHPYTPFFVFGLEGESPALSNTAANQVGVWVKGGLTF